MITDSRLRVTWILVVALLVAGLLSDTLYITLAAALVALPAAVITIARWLEARRLARVTGITPGRSRGPRRQDRRDRS